MAGGEVVMVAGVGLRPACEGGEIVGLVERAVGLVGGGVFLLAAPWFRAGSGAVLQAAGQLGVAVRWVSEGELLAVQGLCLTRSLRAVGAVGVASVAEGCALAAAGAGRRLVLARISSGNATCAVATCAAAGGLA